MLLSASGLPATQHKSRRGGGKGSKSGAMGASGIGATVAALNADLADKLDIETEEGVVIVKRGSRTARRTTPASRQAMSSSPSTAPPSSPSPAVVTAVRDAEVGDIAYAFVVATVKAKSGNLSLDVTVEEGYGFRGAGAQPAGPRKPPGRSLRRRGRPGEPSP